MKLAELGKKIKYLLVMEVIDMFVVKEQSQIKYAPRDVYQEKIIVVIILDQ